MKKIKSHFLFFLLLLVNVNSSNSASPKIKSEVSFQIFYDELMSYGNWVSYPGYGYVWFPNAEEGFSPYITNGHWTFTNLGWTWISEYDWGWAPFHYGTWLNNPPYGWMWVPGYEWAPAWVVWGKYLDYYGWAPIAPGFVSSQNYIPSIEYWCFIHSSFLAKSDWFNHSFIAKNNQIIISQKIIIRSEKNIHLLDSYKIYNLYLSGPSRQEIEKQSLVKIIPILIQKNTKPGKSIEKNGFVQLYCPKIKEDRNFTKPSRVVSIEKLKLKPKKEKPILSSMISPQSN